MTSLEPGIAVSRGRDQAAGARLRGRERQAALAAAVEHDLLDRPAVRASRGSGRAARASAASSARRRSSAAGSATRSTWISKSRAQIVTSSPSPSPPASWNACATCDSPGAEEAKRAPQRRRAARRARGAPARSRARSARAAAARPAGPGRTITGVPCASTTRPGAVPARPSEIAPVGQRRLLADALREVRVRPLHPLGDHARDASICASSSSSTSQLRARRPSPRPRPCGRRGSARDRPRHATRSAAATRLAQRRLELGRVVADDVDPRRLEPEREQRAGEERAVQVGALAAHELAAGDDDRPPAGGRRRGQLASAAKIFFAVTKTPCALTAAPGASPGCRSASRARSRATRAGPRAPCRRSAASGRARACPGRASLADRAAASGRSGTSRRASPAARAATEPGGVGAAAACGRGRRRSSARAPAASSAPPKRQATITSAVTSPIAVSASRTMFDSRRSALRRLAAGTRRGARIGASSSPITKRELYSST